MKPEPKKLKRLLENQATAYYVRWDGRKYCLEIYHYGDENEPDVYALPEYVSALTGTAANDFVSGALALRLKLLLHRSFGTGED